MELSTEDVATDPRRAGYYADCHRCTVPSESQLCDRLSAAVYLWYWYWGYDVPGLGPAIPGM
jgi:hypothetical protein